MGTASEDCQSVARLLGTKIFVNELIAYRDLGSTITFRNNIIANQTYDLYKEGILPIPKDILMLWNVRKNKRAKKFIL